MVVSSSFFFHLLLFFLVCGKYIIIIYVCVCMRVKSLVCRQQVGVWVCALSVSTNNFETMAGVVVVVVVRRLFARLNISKRCDRLQRVYLKRREEKKTGAQHRHYDISSIHAAYWMYPFYYTDFRVRNEDIPMWDTICDHDVDVDDDVDGSIYSLI